MQTFNEKSTGILWYKLEIYSTPDGMFVLLATKEYGKMKRVPLNTFEGDFIFVNEGDMLFSVNMRGGEVRGGPNLNCSGVVVKEDEMPMGKSEC